MKCNSRRFTFKKTKKKTYSFEGQLLVQWSTLLVFWQVRWLQEGQKGQRVFSAVLPRKDAQGGPADVTLDHACSREAFLWLNRRQSQNLWLPENYKKIIKKNRQKNHQKNRSNANLFFRTWLKVAFFQKVRWNFFRFSNLRKTNIPKNYPELEIYISRQ